MRAWSPCAGHRALTSFIRGNILCLLLRSELASAKTAVQGRFVLDDSMLKWLQPLRPPRGDRSAGGEAGRPSGGVQQRAAAQKAICDLYLALACACVKGALSHLNVACTVMGTCDTAPACAPSLAALMVLCSVNAAFTSKALARACCRAHKRGSWQGDVLCSSLCLPTCDAAHRHLRIDRSAFVLAGTFTVDIQG